MMDTLLLALPYYVCSVAAFGTTCIAALSVWRKIYPRRILLLAAGCLCLGVSFFLIAATAGAHGHIDRGAVAVPIRILDGVGGVLWLTWLILAIRGAVRVEKGHPAGG